MVSHCCRCGDFKERNEMETRLVEGSLICMCTDCWEKEDERKKMKDFTIHIKKIVVLITDGTDSVSIHTDLPSPYPAEFCCDDLRIDFQTRKGGGIDYVREHFGIEPEVIDVQSQLRAMR